MGLSDDQRAMLRLLAQRGEQGYEDIAALMGLSVDEVRVKVAAALAELDEEGALGGSAKPADPQQTTAPAEAKPEAPAPPPPAPAAAAPPPPAPEPRPAQRMISLPSGQRLWAAIAGGAIVVALIVIAVIVGNSGGGDSEPATAASGTTSAETASTGETASSESGQSTDPNEVTKAVLKPVDGSEAEGVAIFGRVKESESKESESESEALALEVAAKGLQPTMSGEAYTIWLSQGKKKMLPLASTPAKKGSIAAQFAIPVEVLGYLANETFKELALTLTTTKTLKAALKTATEEKTTPTYTGTEVLRGTVTGPIVGAAARLEELEAEEEGEKQSGE